MIYVLSAKNGNFGKVELAVSGGSTVVISSIVNLHFLKQQDLFVHVSFLIHLSEESSVEKSFPSNEISILLARLD